jgi:hypothetical protein
VGRDPAAEARRVHQEVARDHGDDADVASRRWRRARCAAPCRVSVSRASRVGSNPRWKTGSVVRLIRASPTSAGSQRHRRARPNGPTEHAPCSDGDQHRVLPRSCRRRYPAAPSPSASSSTLRVVTTTLGRRGIPRAHCGVSCPRVGVSSVRLAPQMRPGAPALGERAASGEGSMALRGEVPSWGETAGGSCPIQGRLATRKLFRGFLTDLTGEESVASQPRFFDGHRRGKIAALSRCAPGVRDFVRATEVAVTALGPPFAPPMHRHGLVLRFRSSRRRDEAKRHGRRTRSK